MPAINISLAAYPGRHHIDAANDATTAIQTGDLVEPSLGSIVADHIQLVPQSAGRLDAEMCELLMQAHPATQFRLHANVAVLSGQRLVADLSNAHEHLDYFKRLAMLSADLGAPAYTAHAGYRQMASMSSMLDNARRLADIFECPVGVEGLYPTRGDPYLVSNWDEYLQLFQSGIPYAIDLSHLNILAAQSKHREDGLVREMLASEKCIEVHLSDNDGTGDWHQVCETQIWWHDLLPHINENAVVFTEGNHRKKRKPPVTPA